jgi:hypothetical protein
MSVPSSPLSGDGKVGAEATASKPFFIGDGRRNDFTTLQYYVVPAGATRLFLGTMDGYDWINNVGILDVEVTASVPEPATLVLVGAGLLGAARRRVRRR